MSGLTFLDQLLGLRARKTMEHILVEVSIPWCSKIQLLHSCGKILRLQSFLQKMISVIYFSRDPSIILPPLQNFRIGVEIVVFCYFHHHHRHCWILWIVPQNGLISYIWDYWYWASCDQVVEYHFGWGFWVMVAFLYFSWRGDLLFVSLPFSWIHEIVV